MNAASFEAPPLDPEELKKCIANGDCLPIVLPRLAYMRQLCLAAERLDPSSDAIRPMPAHEWHMLVGRLNHCSRLVAAILTLTHAGQFRESVSILARSLFEAAVKVCWLCNPNEPQRFTQLYRTGFKEDVKVKLAIEAKVAAAGGTVLNIDRRVIALIDALLAEAGVSVADVQAATIPDFFQICTQTGIDALTYRAGYSLPCHDVHGNWTSTKMYIEQDGRPKAPDGLPTNDMHIIGGVLLLLNAVESFLRYVIVDDELREGMVQPLGEEHARIDAILNPALGDDFAAAP